MIALSYLIIIGCLLKGMLSLSRSSDDMQAMADCFELCSAIILILCGVSFLLYSCIIAFLFKDAFTSKMHSLQALSFPLYPSYQSSCLTFNHDSPIFPSRNHIPYSGECGLCSSSISASLLTSAPSTHAAVLSLTHLSCSP